MTSILKNERRYLNITVRHYNTHQEKRNVTGRPSAIARSRVAKCQQRSDRQRNKSQHVQKVRHLVVHVDKHCRTCRLSVEPNAIGRWNSPTICRWNASDANAVDNDSLIGKRFSFASVKIQQNRDRVEQQRVVLAH